MLHGQEFGNTIRFCFFNPDKCLDTCNNNVMKQPDEPRTARQSRGWGRWRRLLLPECPEETPIDRGE